jgi:hypothetical protein
MTVGELIEKLQYYDKNATVRGTWEGIEEDIHDIYTDDDVIYLDVDRR